MQRFKATAVLAALFSSSLALAEPVETRMTVPGPEGPLAGTLLAPASETGAAALILPGSGPTDRDGNNAFGMKAATYALLAQGLVDHGVATLRIDKRGLFGSARAIRNANAVTVADYVADAELWADALRRETSKGCVWLIGHSEGGLIALAAAAKGGPYCGLILLTTPGRPIGVLLRRQYALSGVSPEVQQALDDVLTSLEAGRTVDVGELPAAVANVLHPGVQPYLIDLLRLDPPKLAKAANLPTLVVSAGQDLQVYAEDAAKLQGATGGRLLELPTANHMLKTPTRPGPEANFAAYFDPNLPLVDGLVKNVASFVISEREAGRD